MAEPNNELYELLNFELSFIEAGGYGRSVRTPWKPTSIFQDSLSCLNFAEPTRPHSCHECHLMTFVPVEHQAADVPCHFIPLNDKGETLAELEAAGNQAKLEEAVKVWLRATLEQYK